MTKKKVEEPKQEEESKPRMHTIVMKEKHKDGDWLSIDVDTILPILPFGEGHPIVMGIVDDHAYFIPLDQVNWYEQNFGVQNDVKIAQALATERMKQKRDKFDPSSV